MIDKKLKVKAYLYGICAEYLAIIYLCLKGYYFLRRRYKNKLGEIDLIMRKGNMIVFVEVKARKNNADIWDVVGRKQIGRIKRSALMFSSFYGKGKKDYDVRFDLVVVTALWKAPTHISNVWCD